jgi:SecD/SecF fusion protein
LLLFGGATLKDFAFALLIGVASGAYSSIFIASPVLTHWKERERVYRHRRERILAETGFVPAYAGATADIEPKDARKARRAARLTQPEPENVSAAEFEQMKRDLEIEAAEPSRHTSTLTKRLAHTPEAEAPAPPSRKPRRRADRPAPAPPKPANRPAASRPAPKDGDGAPSDEIIHAPDEPENQGVAPTPERPKRPAKPRNRRHGRRR